ncbi:3-deoxy-manno-octulosonate cytidylyltransferase [SAR86 cluster bacterium]|nr:3-deoxy-manno-octulosonate cytidylyltransferase [SAR86 cluster bacterium]
MKKIVIIPARLDSERLPEKPLKLIDKKPMIEWTYQAAKNSIADEIIVATDSNKIKKVVEEFEGNAVLTSDQHQTGTDRIFEVANNLDLQDEDIVINVQGDEPFIDPVDINNIFYSFLNVENNLSSKLETILDHEMTTLYSAHETLPTKNNSNKVKIKVDECISLDFSREVEGDTSDWFIHLGIYGYKFKCLKNFVKWQQSKRELEFKLEQLRALDNGVLIKALPSKSLFHLGVDTEKDLIEANEIAKKF